MDDVVITNTKIKRTNDNTVVLAIVRIGEVANSYRNENIMRSIVTEREAEHVLNPAIVKMTSWATPKHGAVTIHLESKHAANILQFTLEEKRYEKN
jgi:hypothetical protein